MGYKGQPVPTTSYNAYRSKVSDGKSVYVKVPENTVIENQYFYELGGFIGSAAQSVETGAGQTSEIVLTIEQAEYETDQIETAEEYNTGDLLYFKGGKFTTNEADARLVGRVSDGKDNNNVVLFILAPQV
jgi:hypothetical protein